MSGGATKTKQRPVGLIWLERRITVEKAIEYNYTKTYSRGVKKRSGGDDIQSNCDWNDSSG